MANNGGVVVVVAGQDNTDAVFKQIEANLRRTSQSARETESALGQLGERAKTALEYFGLYEGIRGAVDGMKEVVASSLELGEALEKTSKKTGLAIGTLSTLHYAAAVTGSDFEGMSAAVAKLDKSIGDAADGNKKADSFLGAIGLNAKKLATQSDGAEVAFRRLSQTIAATENPIERVRLATGLLGKAGAEQIDTLIKVGNNWDYYKQKATEAGVQLDGQTAASLERANALLRDMQQRIQGAALAFTEGLIPGLTAMVGVIANGKSQRDALVGWGDKMARALAFVAEVAYSTGAAMEFLFSASEGSKFTEAGRRDLEAARELQKQAQQFHDIAFGPSQKSESEPESAPPPSGVRAFHGTGDAEGASKMDAAKKARAAAQLRLDEQTAQLRSQMAKDASEKALAKLEEDHKQELVSDKDFYAQKLALQLEAIEKQKQAAVDKQGDIDKSISGFQVDAKKKGGADAVEDQAKILELRTRRLALDGEIAKLSVEGSKAEIEAATALDELEKKRLERSDELAAKRETTRGGSVSARQKQSADVYADSREKLVNNYGAGSTEVANADAEQATDQSKIAAGGADATYNSQAVAIAAQKSAIQNEEREGVLSTASARQQLVALDKEEADALQPVLAAYKALAQTGDLAAADKVVELQSKIQELENPVNEVAATMRSQFDSVFEAMFDNIGKGKKGWQQLEQQIQKTAISDGYKAFIEPLVQSATGALIPNGGSAKGKAPSVGGIGQALGSLIPGVAKIPGVGKIAGGASDVTVQIINQGSPMESGGATQHQGGAGGDGGDSQFSQRVISVILKDAEQNGSGIQAILGAIQLG